ncbi:MAG: carbohydrate-binding domain-containing protein [Clostridia bacterium]|nr:carbohydrate-binding domain-containing protein [Clostridia bacterium]
MFKRGLGFILAMVLTVMPGCSHATVEPQTTDAEIVTTVPDTSNTVLHTEDETYIALSDNTITVNGEILSGDSDSDVYGANDIIYYESDKDASYGEGTAADAHTAEEAGEHVVVHITKPGTYRVSGKLPKGQIFVDLGDGAKKDPSAVVTLILDNADITCTVAPAVFFYNVYECGVKDEANATAAVDTSAAGANVVIADDSTNTVNGAYVARIYEPGTTDKLHKYDGAFYSRRSMNIFGGEKGNGILHIDATNEGLDSEMHLTVNGGNITITAQNDGINTNEDNISVTTINGGSLTINAGLGEEGDGIDSNGYLVISGGTVITSACDRGPDGGIDADCAILINGGTLIALGNQNGAVSPDSKQNFIYTGLTGSVPKDSTIALLSGEAVLAETTAIKAGTSLVISVPGLEMGKAYTLKTANNTLTVYPAKMEDNQFAPGGMQRPGGNFQRPNDMQQGSPFAAVPEGLDEWLKSADIPEEIRTWIESMRDMANSFGNRGDGMQPPQGMQPDMPLPNA